MKLLSAREAGVLQSVLLTLINLSASNSFLDEMLKLPCIEPLLALIQERSHSASATQLVVARADQLSVPPSTSHSSLSTILASPAPQPYPAFTFSSAPTAASAATATGAIGTVAADGGLRYQCLAGELLDLMCVNADCRYELRMQSANRLFVNLLLSSSSTHDEALLMPLLRCIASMALDEDGSREIRYLGGIPLLLQLLNTRDGREAEVEVGAQIVMAVCAALTQLANDDENAYQICRHNGIVTLTHLFLLPFFAPTAVSPDTQPHTLRVLRYLYSTERNRKPFKRLFPSEVFTLFVDRVGHWKEELRPYEQVVAEIAAMEARVREEMWSALVEMRTASHSKQSNRRVVKGHILQDVLGRGAFGTVYRVMKEGGEKVYAMKEIPLKLIASKTGAAASGSEMRDVELRAHVDGFVKEVFILSQLNHPNIVRYYSSFVDSGSMYIVMELVEGTSLLDHITSHTDRGGTMSEEQIWPVFIQLCLALSYMHIDKRVVHRDLTSNNIMIDPRRRVKVMDLGLALQRREREEVMNKPAGTIAFSCPEIVTGDEYTDKADIWSLGCILYQMATGKAPFGSENPIAVTRRVVSGQYAAVDSSFSPLLHEVVRRLLTVDPKQRPDILQVSFLISPLLMAQLDRVNQNALRLEQELHHEQEARKQERDEWMREKQMWRKVMANRGSNNNGTAAVYHNGSSLSTATTTPSSIASSASSSLSSSQSLVSLPVVHSEEIAPAEPHSGSSTTSSDSPTPLLPASTSHSRNQSLLVISPTKLRPLSNPLDSLLQQVHKLVYISQLPPRMQKDKRRALINKYKTALFRSGESGGGVLKREMQAVLLMDEEWIDGKFGVQMADDTQTGLTISMAAALDSTRRDDVGKRVTHEDMHLMIEQILREEGYYQQEEHSSNNHHDILSSGSNGTSSSSSSSPMEWKEGEWRLEQRTDSGAESDGSSADGSRRRAHSELHTTTRRLHESRVREIENSEVEADKGRERQRAVSSSSSSSSSGESTGSPPLIRRVREKDAQRSRSSHHSQSDKVSDALTDERRRTKEEKVEERPATAEPQPTVQRTPRERDSTREGSRRESKAASSVSSRTTSKANSTTTSNAPSLNSSPRVTSHRKLSTSSNGSNHSGAGGIDTVPSPTVSSSVPTSVTRSSHSLPLHAAPATAASSPLAAPIKQSVYPAPHPAPFTSPPSNERRPQAARNLFHGHTPPSTQG